MESKRYSKAKRYASLNRLFQLITSHQQPLISTLLVEYFYYFVHLTDTCTNI